MKLSELLNGTYSEVINSMLPFSKLKGYDESLVRIHIDKVTIEYAVWKAINGFYFYDLELDKYMFNGEPIKDKIVKEWKVIDEDGERIRAYRGVLDITLK